MSKMADTLDRLTATITDGFAFLRQVVQPLPPPPPPYYSFPFQGRDPFGQAYAHTPPPHPNSYGNTPTNVVPLSTMSLIWQTHMMRAGRMQFLMQALNEKD